MGYSFILSFGSFFEEKSKILDFVIHPNYIEKITQFLEGTINIGKEKGINSILSYVMASDKDKLLCLLKVGFKEESSLPNYCFLDDRYFDLK